MQRKIFVSLHLFQDFAGVANDLVFDAGQRQRIESRLKTLFTPSQQLLQGDSFSSEFRFASPTIPRDSRLASDFDLLNSLTTLGTPAAPDGAWAARVLIARSSSHDAPLGVMFDTFGRGACAVFLAAVADGHQNNEQLLVRTICHELGHVFNLAHEDAADDTDVLHDPPTSAGVTSPQILARFWDHLLRHDPESVRPGGAFRFTRRGCASLHPANSFGGPHSGNSFALAGSGSLRLRLKVSPGIVYPNPTQPTFVVGEPLFLSLKLENASQRAVFVPRSPGTAMQDMVVQRLDPAGCVVNLSPPLLYCNASRPDCWLRIAPGSSATFQETLLFRGGELVFPQEGTYQLAARLRLRNRWLSSDAVTVRIAPPLEKRHERSSDLAAHPESGLFVELGGSLSVPARDRLAKLRRDNPKFPLNPLVQLLDARNRVLAEAATPQKDRQRLQQLADDDCLPPALRAEAQLLLLLDRAQAGDSQARKRLRQRLAKRDRLPIAPQTAHLIRRNLTQL